MTLNVEKLGKPLAVIEGKGYLDGKQIWVATGSDKPKEGFPRLDLPEEFHFQQNQPTFANIARSSRRRIQTEKSTSSRRWARTRVWMP